MKFIFKKGFRIKHNNVFEPQTKKFFGRDKLIVAHPTANALLFYAINDTCVHQQCGLDIFLLEYIAQKMNKEIRLEMDNNNIKIVYLALEMIKYN
jgi:hypothetical protein